MSEQESTVNNVESIERRKHWRDRRASDDRRNPERMRRMTDDCRSGSPRRQSDIAGKLADGDVWWNDETTKYA